MDRDELFGKMAILYLFWHLLIFGDRDKVFGFGGRRQKSCEMRIVVDR